MRRRAPMSPESPRAVLHLWWPRRAPARAWGLALALCLLAACGPAPGGSAAPTPEPTLTPTLAVETRAVTIPTADGVQLVGLLYGHGATAIVLSNQTDTVQTAWRPIAQQFASRGYLALTYDYRGTGASPGVSRPKFGERVTDELAAIEVARGQGATRVILIGASIGAEVVAQAAGQATAPVAGIALLSCPSALDGEAVLQSARIAKLFVASENDTGDEARAAFAAAAPPKDLRVYPGSSHGVGIFGGVNGSDLTVRLFAFVQTYAGA